MTFWSRSEYSLKNHPPASQSDINSAESRLGVRLPDLLKEFYSMQNGGPVQTTKVEDTESGKEYFPLMDGLRTLDMLESFQTLSKETDFGGPDSDPAALLPNSELVIIIANHGFDWFLCLDYTKSGPGAEPEVVYYDLRGGLTELFRADNFEDFVAHLATPGS